MNRTTKRIGALGTATVAVMGTGIAFAAWTAGGSGSGDATALTAQPLTVTSATTSPDLYPGLTTGKVYVSIENDNPYDVTVTQIAQDTGDVTLTAGDNTPTGTSAGTCAGTMFTLATKTVSWSVPAGQTKTFNVAGVTLDHSAPDNCQDQTATIPVTVTGAQD